MAYKFVPYTAGGSGGGSATLTELSVTLNGTYEPTSEIKVGDVLRAKDQISVIDFPERIWEQICGSAETLLASSDGLTVGAMMGNKDSGDFLLGITLGDTQSLYITEAYVAAILGVSGPGGWYGTGADGGLALLSGGPEITVTDESMAEALNGVTYLFHVSDPPDGFSKVNVNVPASGSLQRYINIDNEMDGFFYRNNPSSYGNVLAEDVSVVLSGLDTSKVTSLSQMFRYCRLLVAIPWFDTSAVTNMSYMFDECKKLESIPALDTSSVTTMSNMFSNCNALREIPLLDTKALTNASSMFWACGLSHIPALDFRNVTRADSAMGGMSNIRDIHVKNIKTSIMIGNCLMSTDGKLIESWGTNLTVDSLIHVIYELRDTGTTNTLSMASYNIDKLASVYVRLIEVTDEMRSEDDLVDEKKPFEVCESTDEGAMLITDYVLTKNWTLA